MNPKMLLFVLFICGILLIVGFYGFMRVKIPRDYEVKSVSDVVALFPKTVTQLNRLVEKTKADAQERVEKIIAIPDNERTFANTAHALDRAADFYFSVPVSIIAVLKYLSPDDALRNAANKAIVELSQFGIDMFGLNIKLYEAFKAYVQGNAKKESLTDEQKYFLKETMDSYKRAGLELPKEKREKVKKLEKELAELSTQFSKNINEDKSRIIVTRQELEGMDEDFINSLEKTEDGNYILTTDYPIYFPILEYNKVPSTRKKMYHAFLNKAYPENKEILNKIIALRDELAKILGYESFAALNIDNEMAKKPERAKNFINNLIEKAKLKEQQEFEQLTKDLPDSVVVEHNKFNPWDVAFAKEYYKKKYYEVDDREIKKYFPVKKTIDGLLDIYQKFFNLTFKEVPVSGLWDKDAKMVEAYKDDVLLGYLILDLYPRPNKYNHACEITVVPALKADDGSIKPAVAVVIANFPKPTPDRPSLLELKDVRTFFHEFGHAIHTILGATQLASFSGTNVKTDFVEMPSQMLEEWLWDADILKQLSSHYQTGEPLPDELIKKIIALKNFSSGAWVLQQALYSLMALDYFAPGAQKDIIDIMFALQEKTTPHTHIYKESRMPFSWGHLTGYGAKYYGYLWSKVFALDLFNHIKKYGLLNPEIGQVYAQKVIGKGGSQDPNELLKDFLGREPNADAFFADLGL